MWHALQNTFATLRSAEWIYHRACPNWYFLLHFRRDQAPSQFSMMQRTLAESHIPFPHASAFFVSLVEFVAGAGLVVGLLTPLCALVLLIDMIIALATNRVHSIQASTPLS